MATIGTSTVGTPMEDVQTPRATAEGALAPQLATPPGLSPLMDAGSLGTPGMGSPGTPGPTPSKLFPPTWASHLRMLEGGTIDEDEFAIPADFDSEPVDPDDYTADEEWNGVLDELNRLEQLGVFTPVRREQCLRRQTLTWLRLLQMPPLLLPVDRKFIPFWLMELP